MIFEFLSWNVLRIVWFDNNYVVSAIDDVDLFPIYLGIIIGILLIMLINSGINNIMLKQQIKEIKLQPKED